MVIDANLGTTSTGWIVFLLRLKFPIGTLLLPIIGIDVMQGGMGGPAEQVDLSQYSAAGIQARLMLVLIGTG